MSTIQPEADISADTRLLSNPFSDLKTSGYDSRATKQMVFIDSGIGQSPAPELFVGPLPAAYTANYASFSTAFLSKVEIEACWNDTPIVIDHSYSVSDPETQFLEAVGRVSDPHFAQRVKRGSIIDLFGLNTSYIKFIATYSHLIDNHDAYIRLVAYNQQGERCNASHPKYGNRILVIPRNVNNVEFPSPLRFHALHMTDTCHYPDEAHHRIREAAMRHMTPLETVWWEFGRCAICDTDL